MYNQYSLWQKLARRTYTSSRSRLINNTWIKFRSVRSQSCPSARNHGDKRNKIFRFGEQAGINLRRRNAPMTGELLFTARELKALALMHSVRPCPRATRHSPHGRATRRDLWPAKTNLILKTSLYVLYGRTERNCHFNLVYSGQPVFISRANSILDFL